MSSPVMVISVADLGLIIALSAPLILFVILLLSLVWSSLAFSKRVHESSTHTFYSLAEMVSAPIWVLSYNLDEQLYCNRGAARQLEESKLSTFLDVLAQCSDLRNLLGSMSSRNSFGTQGFSLHLDKIVHCTVQIFNLEGMLVFVVAGFTPSSDSSATQKKFLTACSHELRSPLNAMLGMLEVAQEHPAMAEDTNLKNIVSLSFASSCYLLHLVNNILDVSQIKAGKFSSTQRICVIRDLYHCVCELISTTASQKQVTLKGRFSNHLPRQLAMDATRVVQILFNFISNAIKYTSADGMVEVKVDILFGKGAGSMFSEPSADFDAANSPCSYLEHVYCSDGQVHPYAGQFSSKAFIDLSSGKFKRLEPETPTYRCTLRTSVTDTGKGISEENLKQLFSLFGRVDTDQDKDLNPTGCGVGLVLSKELCEEMGGHIGVKSTVGHGTTFYFDVPVQAIMI